MATVFPNRPLWVAAGVTVLIAGTLATALAEGLHSDD